MPWTRGTWGRGAAFDTNFRDAGRLESKKNRRAFQVSRGAPERGAGYSQGQYSAHPFRLHRRNFGAGLLIQRVSPGRDSVRDGACEHDFRKSFWGQWPAHGHHLIDDHDESTHDECDTVSVLCAGKLPADELQSKEGHLVRAVFEPVGLRRQRLE
jgi:hypothetical protein